VSTTLPVASTDSVKRYVGDLLSRRRRLVGAMVALHCAATLAGLAAPALVGRLVEAVRDGTTTAYVDRTLLLLLAALVAQTLLTRAARYRGFVFGEVTLAELREGFVRDSLALPLGAVERAGNGELVTRTTRDVDALQWTARHSLPETVVALVQVLLTVGAALLVGLWVAVPIAVGLPFLAAALTWYLRRAREGYLREHESYALIASGLTETVEGARTVEALSLQGRRMRRAHADVAASYASERYTLWLRTWFFPVFEVTVSAVPVAGTMLLGGWLYLRGDVDLGAVTAATLYVRMLADPMDRLVSVLDELQTGAVSLARLLGVRDVPEDRVITGRRPGDEKITATDVRFAYDGDRDVLHGLDLDLRVGERLAVVGPSGAGKSTLGRLLAGIHPPRTGSVTVDDVGLTELPLAELRRHVALVTQENHVFAGTLRDNVALAHPDEVADAAVWRALAAVDADQWVAALPDGLATPVGSGGAKLSPAQAQQVALARLVLVDPHTLVLDEATSMVDPRAARHLERSLAGVLEGRTVVAIAHRLFSAHDADRVAVVEDGVVTEIGTHDELVERDGSYAALWRSWQA
jgi:ABC-type multidrug transport system fused ATPase/permease subunit